MRSVITNINRDEPRFGVMLARRPEREARQRPKNTKRCVMRIMKKTLTLLLALAMLFALPAPAASAAETDAIKEQYAQFDSQYANWMYSAYCYETAYWPDVQVVDLDGDGKLEAITLASTLTVADAAAGTVKWQYTAEGRRASLCDFVVKDLDGDGALEIAVGYNNGTVALLSNKGNMKSGWPQKLAEWDAVRSLAAADVDGDGKQELIVGLQGAQNTLRVLKYDGTALPGWSTAAAGAYMDGTYANSLATGDLDGDGRPEIIMPADNQFINAFHADGSLVKASSVFGKGNCTWSSVGMYEDYKEELAWKNAGWGWGIDYEPVEQKGRAGTYSPNLSNSTTRYVDVDGDGTSEIVVSVLMMDRTNYFKASGRDWTVGTKDSKYMTVAILNQDRTRFNNGTCDWTSIPTDLGGTLGGPMYYDANSMAMGVESVPVVADVNGDGVNEILFNSFDGKVHCYSLKDSSKELAGWPYVLPKTNGSSAFEVPGEVVCADLNGDGRQEVIFGSAVKDSNGSNSKDGALYIVDGNGKLVVSQPLHKGVDEGGVNTINGCMGAPAVRDVDGDGKFEILLNTTKFGLCCYEVTMAYREPVKPAQPQGKAAIPTNNKLTINGKAVTPTAYKIDGANYFKLRDLAALLNETTGKFNVDYDGALKAVTVTSGKGYEKLGTDLQVPPAGNQTATVSKDATYINGQKVDGLTVYKINNNNYYKLRDLAGALGTFEVGYDDATMTATITTK